ncbi:MAG TPA: TIGR03435 family protein [Vicinamibacterales bacterium]|nr:TIGR03435 family protein [Vicinamibacterales bacterium]
MTRGLFALLAVGLVVGLQLSAQQQPADPNAVFFEAASIKPTATSDGNSFVRRQPGGRFDAHNVAARFLLTFSYQLQPFQVIGDPDWVGKDRFDINAKMEGDPPPMAPGAGIDPMMLAVRTLLADRFKLVMHKETRQLDIYALIMARPGGKPGPALKPSTTDCAAEAKNMGRGGPPPGPNDPVTCGSRQNFGRIKFGGMPLAVFATNISGQLGRTVVDRTGLTGNWDFELTFAPERPLGALPPGVDLPPVDPNAPTIFTAVQEQLGLKLDSTKGPVDVWVIDSIEKPTPD